MGDQRSILAPDQIKGEAVKDVKHIIAVASGKGGVGKSTTAVNLALALSAAGARVGLLDADIYGPSQQIMLGIAEDVRPDQKDGKFLLPVMAHGLATMSMGRLRNVVRLAMGSANPLQLWNDGCLSRQLRLHRREAGCDD